MNDIRKANNITKMLTGTRIVRSKRLFLSGRFPTLNDYTKTSRGNKYASATMKRRAEEMIAWEARSQLKSWKAKAPVFMVYCWVVKDKRTDRDNIAFARKFVQDALVKIGAIQDDGWNDVIGFADTFEIDKHNQGVEVWLLEVGDERSGTQAT